MIVPAKPLLQLGSLFAGAGSDYVPPWHKAAFFPTGSDALGAALEYLEIPRGAKVALPALICRSVPDVLVQNGLKPYFCDAADDSLIPTAETVGGACANKDVRLLLLVDFFGFLPSERTLLAEQAHNTGCAVVEDRCHSALTQPDEEIAEAIIFSIRKSLPTTNGGALLLVNEEFCEPLNDALPFQNDVFFIALRLLEDLVVRIGWPNIYADLVTVLRQGKRIPVCEDNFHPDQRSILPTGPSWLLRQQLRRASFLAEVAQRRRDNYLRLAQALMDAKPLFRIPDEKIVPQVFPLLDPSGGLVDYLRRFGVGAFRWPGDELPEVISAAPDKFPNAVRFNREIACLPIHQSIEMRHIERMAELFERYQAAGG